MAATANSTSLINIVAMQGNVLRGNTLAGITLVGNQAGTIVGNMAGNTIDSNGGRGLDVTANGSSDIRLTFTGNTIIGNLGEGAVFATNAGALLTSDSLDIIFTNNILTANGQPGDFGGLVFRIGSSEFGASRARVTNNTFAGNSGPDVYIESYTATPNPPVIPLPFGPYPDPLARFDLKFIDNVGEEADVTNFGAFYSNADILKSPNVPPPNPFFATTRLRNAQRQVGVVVPFVGLSGTGQSTFNVEADGSVAGFTTQLSTFGTAAPLGPGADEFLFPFVWNIVPVGTLFP